MKTKADLLVFLSVTVFFVFTLTSCVEEAPSEATEDPYAIWKAQKNEKIVFMSRADSQEGELYLLDKNGQITRLTNNNRHENNPALSFDGKKVAFNGGEESNQLTWEIYILDLESGKETRITSNGVIDAHPDWSPDDNKIVFGSFRDAQGNPAGTADIFMVNLDGDSLVRLTDNDWEDNDPEWSPDGTKIVFKSTQRTQQAGREEIYVMNTDGSDPKRLTTTDEWQSDHDPSWSPDSQYILFTRFEGHQAWFEITDFADNWEELTPWNVHRVNLQGNTERITNNTESGWGVVLCSLNGTKILYGRTDWIINGNRVIGGYHRLILMNPDGSNQQQLLPDDEHTGTLEYFDW